MYRGQSASSNAQERLVLASGCQYQSQERLVLALADLLVQVSDEVKHLTSNWRVSYAAHCWNCFSLLTLSFQLEAPLQPTWHDLLSLKSGLFCDGGCAAALSSGFETYLYKLYQLEMTTSGNGSLILTVMMHDSAGSVLRACDCCVAVCSFVCSLSYCAHCILLELLNKL